MTIKSTGWTKEKRERAAKKAREIKPWKHTTGPKTKEGKAASSQNALKSGLHTQEMNELRKVLHKQAKILRDLPRLPV